MRLVAGLGHGLARYLQILRKELSEKLRVFTLY